MTWQTEMTFGKYKGVKLMAAWIKDKDYFVWLINQECDRPEIEFIKDELTKAEKRQLKLEL